MIENEDIPGELAKLRAEVDELRRLLGPPNVSTPGDRYLQAPRRGAFMPPPERLEVQQRQAQGELNVYERLATDLRAELRGEYEVRYQRAVDCSFDRGFGREGPGTVNGLCAEPHCRACLMRITAELKTRLREAEGILSQFAQVAAQGELFQSAMGAYRQYATTVRTLF